MDFYHYFKVHEEGLYIVQLICIEVVNSYESYLDRSCALE